MSLMFDVVLWVLASIGGIFVAVKVIPRAQEVYLSIWWKVEMWKLRRFQKKLERKRPHRGDLML